MAVDKIRRGSAPSKVGWPNANSIRVDNSSEVLVFGTGTSGTTEKTVMDTSSTQTVTGKTFTAPTITAPVITGDGSGYPIVKRCTLTEAAAATSYTASVVVPALAIIHDILVIARVLWNGTSATGKVGDTADDDGIFTGIDLKSTDLVVGEMLSAMHSTLWGGKEGAYLVAATGRRGPTTSNFGMSYVAGSTLAMIVTPGAADGTAGRTDFVVVYSNPTTVSQVVV